MRSPSRLGKPALGMPLTRRSSTLGEFAENRQQRLRAERAVRADDLNVFCFELRGSVGGTQVAVGGAFFGISELRDDRQAGEGTNRVDGEKQFFDVGKRFENEKIDAAFFESERLLVKNVLNFVGLGMARLHAEAERADRAGDQHFARSGFAGFAGDFHAAAVEALHFVGEAERRELEAIRAERIGLDDLRAGFDVGLVHAEDGFGLGGIQLVEAALRADSFVQHRAHRAIGDENRIFQPFVEIENFQTVLHCTLMICARGKSLSVFVP